MPTVTTPTPMINSQIPVTSKPNEPTHATEPEAPTEATLVATSDPILQSTLIQAKPVTIPLTPNLDRVNAIK
jgi:hypothetical protein